MIEYIKQDITKIKDGIVGQGVNCRGVMGSGVALAIRKQWPIVFDYYELYVKQAVSEGKSPKDLLGDAQIIQIYDDLYQSNLYVANIFSQENYGSDGKKYADKNAICRGLLDLFDFASTTNFEAINIYLPRIGCGLGGLDWNTDMLPIIENLSKAYPEFNIYICDI